MLAWIIPAHSLTLDPNNGNIKKEIFHEALKAELKFLGISCSLISAYEGAKSKPKVLMVE